MYVYRNANGGTALPAYLDIREGRGAGNINTCGNQETTRYSNGLYRLVYGTGSHTLNIYGDAVFDHPGDGTSNGGR